MEIISIKFIEFGCVVAQMKSEDDAFFWLSGRHSKNKLEYRALMSEWKSRPGREIVRSECVMSSEKTSMTDERLYILDNGLGH